MKSPILKLFCLVPLLLLSFNALGADCSETGLPKLREKAKSQSFMAGVNLSLAQNVISKFSTARKNKAQAKLVINPQLRPAEGSIDRKSAGLIITISQAKALQAFLSDTSKKQNAALTEELERFKIHHEYLGSWDEKNKVAKKQNALMIAAAQKALLKQELAELDSLMKAIDRACPPQKAPSISSGKIKMLPSHGSGPQPQPTEGGPVSLGGNAGSAKDPRDVHQPDWSNKPQMTQ
ncbi:MAG TPA: hypothetical protein DCS07_06390 [Bdellovibrionales bacterium]|nr:MAG: hypothetical protein A2Z97_12295 [Bdellovibrionales bacterium GWB1_52_6]OFZ03722.1 MAG: hypothetical protein A2X97_14275 [Bdellovibrionales bacterium GWA1_52_35]OFZ41129.1 MAG: hypothetical protein A2070_08675 [Bdellovibrionales bacterium GWC1_52_8]HAR42245.1 hypothetical protein [Bdellovibrionales bacterium]HCM38766.1 hypothetical protein [Bdellovibrionales bacterium]